MSAHRLNFCTQTVSYSFHTKRTRQNRQDLRSSTDYAKGFFRTADERLYWREVFSAIAASTQQNCALIGTVFRPSQYSRTFPEVVVTIPGTRCDENHKPRRQQYLSMRLICCCPCTFASLPDNKIKILAIADLVTTVKNLTGATVGCPTHPKKRFITADAENLCLPSIGVRNTQCQVPRNHFHFLFLPQIPVKRIMLQINRKEIGILHRKVDILDDQWLLSASRRRMIRTAFSPSTSPRRWQTVTFFGVTMAASSTFELACMPLLLHISEKLVAGYLKSL